MRVAIYVCRFCYILIEADFTTIVLMVTINQDKLVLCAINVPTTCALLPIRDSKVFITDLRSARRDVRNSLAKYLSEDYHNN